MNGYEEMRVNGGANEWTSSEQKIYKSCVNIEWMSWWMPLKADGVNELMNIIQFILVMMHIITRYMCTYVCLHPTGYGEYTI